MGSIFPSDHSGVWGITLGLVGLILFGVTASLFIDGDFTLGGDPADSEAGELEAQDAELAALAGELDRLQLLKDRKVERQRAAGPLKLTIQRIAMVSLQAEELEAAIDAERDGIEKTAGTFEAYQMAYRDWLWRSASRRQIETLRSRDGKVYEEVVITEVSAEGIRIRHKAGVANISALLMPKELCDELMIDLAESQRMIRERREAEIAAQEKRRRAQRPRNLPVPRSPGREADEPEEEPVAHNRVEILTLHEEVASLSSRLSQLRTELSDARIRASGLGRNRSAPGSLETWEGRVLRLSKIEQRAEAKLSVLRARLKVIDPDYRPPMRP